MLLYLLLQEFWQDIKAHRIRAILTTSAITWGILAVTLLMAFGQGMSYRMREGFLNAGDMIIRVYGGQTTKHFAGLPLGRRILLREEDCEYLERNIPQIATAIPGLGRHVRLRNKDVISSTYMEGVYPDFEFLRRTFPAAGGRFLNSMDLQERAPTCSFSRRGNCQRAFRAAGSHRRECGNRRSPFSNCRHNAKKNANVDEQRAG